MSSKSRALNIFWCASHLCSRVQTVQVDSRASAPLCTATRTDLVPPAAWRTHETLLETTVKHTGQALTQFKPTSLHWCIEDSSYEADLEFTVRRRIYNVMHMYLWNHHVSTWSSICSSNWLHSKSVFSQAASTISRSRVSLNQEGSENRCQNTGIAEPCTVLLREFTILSLPCIIVCTLWNTVQKIKTDSLRSVTISL